MKNIFRIFKNDVSRIRSNVIAMIVIMGITDVPVKSILKLRTIL